MKGTLDPDPSRHCAWRKAQALRRGAEAAHHEPLARLLALGVPTPGLSALAQWHAETAQRPDRDGCWSEVDLECLAAHLHTEDDPWVRGLVADQLWRTGGARAHATAAWEALQEVRTPAPHAPVQVLAEHAWALARSAELAARLRDTRRYAHSIERLEHAFARARARSAADPRGLRRTEAALRWGRRAWPRAPVPLVAPRTLAGHCRRTGHEATHRGDDRLAADWHERGAWWLALLAEEEAAPLWREAARARAQHAHANTAPGWVRARQLGIALARLHRAEEPETGPLRAQSRRWAEERLSLLARYGLTGEEAGTGIPRWDDALRAIARSHMRLPCLPGKEQGPHEAWEVRWNVDGIESGQLDRTREEHGPIPSRQWRTLCESPALASTAVRTGLRTGLAAGYDGHWSESVHALAPALRTVATHHRERLNRTWCTEVERIVGNPWAPDFAQGAHPPQAVARIRVWLWWLALFLCDRTSEGRWREPPPGVRSQVDSETLHRNAQNTSREDPNDWEPMDWLVHASARAGT